MKYQPRVKGESLLSKKSKLWIGLVISILALFFSLAGFVTAIFLSAMPNYPLNKAERDSIVWMICAVVFFLLTVVLAVMLAINYRRRKK
jgi:hypothetical protein